MFVTPPNVTLTLTDGSGNPVETETYTEDPLIDDVGGTPSGSPVKITILPKPNLNEYILNIENNGGSYNLNAYLYDANGKVTLFNSSGNLSVGEEKNLLFTLEKNKC